MKRIGLVCVLLLGAILVSTSASAETALAERFSDQQLVNILKAEGYSSVEVLDPGEILIKINGRPYMLFVEKDGDLRAYYGISGVKVSCEDVNTWNRTRRLSRAFLDDENDPVLESDLLANGGLSPKHVTEFLKVFTDSANAFHNFIMKQDQS